MSREHALKFLPLSSKKLTRDLRNGHLVVEDEINLRDYWRILVKRRTLVLGVICAVTLITVIVTLLRPNIYQGKAVLIPLGKPGSVLPSALGDLGGLLSLSGAGQGNPAVRLLAVLQSRTLAEDVIQHLGLLPLLFAEDWDATKQQWRTDAPPTMQDAVRELGNLISSRVDEEKGIITITAEHADPVLAAAIANQYVETLQRALNDNAFSLAKKNRLFLTSQLQKTQQDLIVAEEALQKFEKTYGIVALDVQTHAAVNTLAELEGKIIAKEVQLSVLQRSLTGFSQEVYLLQEELKGLRTQLARFQHGTPEFSSVTGSRAHNSQALFSLDKAPEIKLQYARLQREALIQNQLFILLVQQLEQAKIEEARDETAFQVLDKAIPPEKKIRPKRLLAVIVAILFSAFLGVFVVFFLAFSDTTTRTREQVERQVGLTLLATLPPLASQPHRHKRQAPHSEAGLVLHSSPDAPVVEALRSLYTRLKHLNGERSIQTVLLTCAGPEENVTIPLVNLGIVVAQLGDRTLLVDSNIRQPALHSLLYKTLAPGLAEMLANPSQSFSVQILPLDNLHLIPAGTVTPATFAALESPVFDALLAQWKETYDLILCAAPPVLGCTDAVVLGSKVDATCLVLTCGVSRLEAIVEARSTLEAIKANVIGAVLTDFKA